VERRKNVAGNIFLLIVVWYMAAGIAVLTADSGSLMSVKYETPFLLCLVIFRLAFVHHSLQTFGMAYFVNAASDL
jgi:hypothetical protein